MRITILTVHISSNNRAEYQLSSREEQFVATSVTEKNVMIHRYGRDQRISVAKLGTVQVMGFGGMLHGFTVEAYINNPEDREGLLDEMRTKIDAIVTEVSDRAASMKSVWENRPKNQ